MCSRKPASRTMEPYLALSFLVARQKKAHQLTEILTAERKRCTEHSFCIQLRDIAWQNDNISHCSFLGKMLNIFPCLLHIDFLLLSGQHSIDQSSGRFCRPHTCFLLIYLDLGIRLRESGDWLGHHHILRAAWAFGSCSVRIGTLMQRERSRL